MLFTQPSRYKGGFSLWGDFHDLRSLHETIHFLCDEKGPMDYHTSEYVLGLAYEIRHAYQGDRKEEAFGYDELDKVKYRGAELVWTHILPQMAILRRAAGYQPTDATHQSNLYRMEACIEDALLKSDDGIGNICFDWLQNTYSFPQNYLTSFFTSCTKEFLCEGKGGMQRFKRLPSLLGDLHPMSEKYQAYSAALEEIAAEKGVDPRALSDSSEWPKIKV